MAIQEHPDPGGTAPNELFLLTPRQRIALARRRFFEEGVRPTGAVAEAVIQSWIRCLQAQHEPGWRPAFEPVSAVQVREANHRSHDLIEAARHEIGTLEASLAGTDCRVYLTDGEGVTLHATARPLPDYQPILRCARVGVDLAESLVGTTAPGVVAQTGEAVTVLAGEHFYEALSAVECAAAPIRDGEGRLAGVLDLSIEGSSFGFHAASMVGLYATRIENRLLQLKARHQLVLRFQAEPHLLHTPLEALAGVDANGDVVWLNGVARRILGPQPAGGRSTVALFGLRLAELLALTRCEALRICRLPSGLGVWVRVRLNGGDGADFEHAVATVEGPLAPSSAPPGPTETVPPPVQATPTLDANNRQLIERTLAECDGNISRAARRLGVSRGLLYRRLRADEQPPVFQAGTGKTPS